VTLSPTVEYWVKGELRKQPGVSPLMYFVPSRSVRLPSKQLGQGTITRVEIRHILVDGLQAGIQLDQRGD